MKARHFLVVVLLALAVAPAASAGGVMFVGAAEDHARDLDPVKAKTRMDLAALAGFDAVRMTTIWSPGKRELAGDDLTVLQNAATAAQLDGIRLLLSVYHRDQRSTPLTAAARADFAAYTASIARKVPWIQDFIVGNEPNLNLFWMPQFTAKGGNAAAAAYERLLADTYDALKAVSPEINVIGGAVSPRGQDRPKAARPTHSPATFIPDMGAAYRQSGRTKPIMDMFAFHPYLIPSKLPPTFTNPRNSTVGISDYDKLMQLLVRAFAGTRQPSLTLPIVYDEFGYQSVIPAAKRSAYTNLSSPAAKDAIPEAKQAAQYRQAFAIAQCQPNVAGMLIFHVADEPDARAWQSGVYYADDTPKTSLDAVRSAALRAQEGTLARCAKPKITSSLAYVAFREPTQAPTELGVDFACTVICKYSARVLNTDTGDVAATTAGAAAPGEASVVLAADELAPGTYQYAFRANSAGRAGTAVMRYSRPFTIAAPPAPPPTDPPEPTEAGGDDPGSGEGSGEGADPPPPAPPAPAPAAIRLPSLPQLPTLLPTLAARAPKR
jgi:hypothetical protein